jgi:hypothetical protein
MYLLPSNSGSVNNRKWNLGRMGGNCSARGIGIAPQKRLGRLGDGAGVPAGSQFTYTAQFKSSINPTNSSFYSFGSTISAIKQNLQNQWNIAIVGSQDNAGYLSTTGSATLQIQTLTDYGAVADLKSIIDGSFYNAAGAQVVSSNLVVNKLASPTVPGSVSNIGPTSDIASPQAVSAATAQAGFQDALARGDQSAASQFAAQIQALTGTNPLGTAAQITNWLSSNWPLAAGAGLLGLVVVKEL